MITTASAKTGRMATCAGGARPWWRYRRPAGGGEIDLVAWQGEALVFVEVKTRATGSCGPADRAVEVRNRNSWRTPGVTTRAGVEWKRVWFDSVGIILTRFPRSSGGETPFGRVSVLWAGLARRGAVGNRRRTLRKLRFPE
jgi:Holliday junction resolvase-like predicted endonuclease